MTLLGFKTCVSNTAHVTRRLRIEDYELTHGFQNTCFKHCSCDSPFKGAKGEGARGEAARGSSNLLKRSVKKMIGSGGGAQMGASGPGGAEAGFEQFVKEKC